MIRVNLCLALLLMLFVSDAFGQGILRRRRQRQAANVGLRIRMPNKSYKGKLLPLTKAEQAIAKQLKLDVTMLAATIGERNVYKYANLRKAERFLQDSLQKVGYEVKRQTYQVRGRACSNLIVEIRGKKKPDEIIVVGGHYDSVRGCPGANDNGSGAVATLSLARSFAKKKLNRTLRFVLFVNEEPPWFQTEEMGSLVYARMCKKRGDKIVAMFSLETMGYYSDQRGSQKYPSPLSLFYPSTGNFIGFVGDTTSAKLVTRSVGTFRKHAKFPSEGAAMPAVISGVGWSDHWSFWQVGYPGVMVTDTAPFRYPHYHLTSDTPDKLDYERMAHVLTGLVKVIDAEAK